jgi:hypothetical protein
MLGFFGKRFRGAGWHGSGASASTAGKLPPAVPMATTAMVIAVAMSTATAAMSSMVLGGGRFLRS